MISALTVYSAFAVSLDGKIAYPEPDAAKRFASRQDLAFLKQCWAMADVLLMGAKTFRTYPFWRNANAMPHQPHVAILTRGAAPGNMDGWLTCIPRESAFFNSLPAHTRVTAEILTPCLPSPAIRSIYPDWLTWTKIQSEQTASLWIPVLLRHFQKQGFNALFLEGGAELFTLFLQANALDKIHITVCPLVLGATGVSLYAETSPYELLGSYELVQLHQEASEVFLTYQKRHNPC